MINFMYRNTAKVSEGIQELRVGMENSITKVAQVHQGLEHLAQAQGDIHRFAKATLEAQEDFSRQQHELLLRSQEIKQSQEESKHDLGQVVQLQREALGHAQTQIATVLQGTKELTEAQQVSLAQNTRMMQNEMSHLFRNLDKLRGEYIEGQLETRGAHNEAKQILSEVLNTSLLALAASNSVWRRQQTALTQLHGLLQLQKSSQEQILVQQGKLRVQMAASSRDHREHAAELGNTLKELSMNAEEASEKQKQLLQRSGKVSEAQHQMQATLESLQKWQAHSSRAVMYLLGRNYGLDDIFWFVGVAAGIFLLSQCSMHVQLSTSLILVLLGNLAIERVVCPRMIPFFNHTLQLPFEFVLHDLKWYVRYAALCVHLALIVKQMIRKFKSDAHVPFATTGCARVGILREGELDAELMLAFQRFLEDRVHAHVWAAPITRHQTPEPSPLREREARPCADLPITNCEQNRSRKALFHKGSGCASKAASELPRTRVREAEPCPSMTPERRSERLRRCRLDPAPAPPASSPRPSTVQKTAKRSCPLEDALSLHGCAVPQAKKSKSAH